MNKEKSLAVSLSQEELYVIMAYLGADMLLGLDNAPIKELSDDQYKLAMKVAERALIAREFLIPDGKGKFKLNDVIHALVGACAAPEYSLIIKRSYPIKLPEDYLFHFSRMMIVLHTNPMTAIRQFTALANKELMIKTVASIFDLTNSKKIECPSARLSESKLIMVRDAIRNSNSTEAETILKDSLWAAATIEPFVNSLKTIVHSDAIAYVVHKASGDGDVKGATLLKASNGSWLIHSMHEDQLEIEPTSASKVNDFVKKLINLNVSSD